MVELIYEIVENPAYRHVLLNHLPITGLAVAACVLAWSLVENHWRSIVFALVLCAILSASAIFVLQSGDAAYPILFDKLDGPGQAWLDDHAELAARWGRLIPANALLALVVLGVGWRNEAWRRRAGFAALLGCAISLGAAGVIAAAGGHVRHSEFREAAGSSAPAAVMATEPAEAYVGMRRLTESQYRNVVADAFGPGLEIAGRFEPENRRHGLIAVGSAQAAITASGFEQYEGMAIEIARQALEPVRRETWLPCRPNATDRPDPECVEAMLRAVAPTLLRRPIDEGDLRRRVAVATEGAEAFGDFWVGARAALASVMIAPDFLFRVETAAAGTLGDERKTLSAASLASRLSFFLWNAGPDAALLEAIESGTLETPEGYAAQVDRMIASPRFEAGVRALFSDIFQFDGFADLAKDPVRYPIFSARVAEHAKEQTLRTVVEHLVRRDGDYRSLFTSNQTFMTRILGPVYALPVHAESGWEAVTFGAESARGGLLTHASFNMLHAHAGRSSPTLRGLFIREALLCQRVPPAPADVDFGLFNADDSPEHRTARDRLEVHSTNASCRSCHKLTDPIGLALENFDGMGRHRRSENGAPIDPRGDLDGLDFTDAPGLGAALADHDRLGACLARHAYQAAIGRAAKPSERRWLRTLEARFADAGHRFAPLVRAVVHAPGFLAAPATRSTEASHASVAGSPDPTGDTL